ncbi:MAG: hypothetical protein MSG64_13500 [Pyrinomonadaceae bacterium MAG19_C2-C3]|nr:hypothetical protein [Pyrinomonadaceae bacterium MAG19_C2-C3]
MNKRKPREKYSKRSCSVKPTLEQERQIQYIEDEEQVTRSDIMRAALVDYLLRKRLLKVGKDVRKDPARLLYETILTEQLDPLRAQVEVLCRSVEAITHALSIANRQGDSESISIASLAPIERADTRRLEEISLRIETVYKLLDQVYLCALITQKLTVNFLLDPLASGVSRQNAEACSTLLERVGRGDQGLHETTLQTLKIVKDQMCVLSSLVLDDIEKETGMNGFRQPSETVIAELRAAEAITTT